MVGTRPTANEISPKGEFHGPGVLLPGRGERESFGGFADLSQSNGCITSQAMPFFPSITAVAVHCFNYRDHAPPCRHAILFHRAEESLQYRAI